jgi:hypothetical protein
LKARHGFCRARDADDFGQVDDVGHDACVPTRVDTDERLVVEAAGELKKEPIIAVSTANAEELAPLHLEIKREARGRTQGIVTHLLESFEFEDAFFNLGDGVECGSASAQPQKTL